MKVLLDLNVILDFFEQRAPYSEEANAVFDNIMYGKISGVVPAHCITTLFYLLRKNLARDKSLEITQWLIAKFEVAPCDKSVFELLPQAHFATSKMLSCPCLRRVPIAIS